MGRRGPVGKRPDRKVGAGKPVRLEILPGGRVEPPPPPAGLLAATRDAWEAFWRSDVAQAVTEADLPALHRLFELRDERTRALRVARKFGRLDEGSKGQARIAPALELVLKLESTIGRLETELGLTPMARARLGLTAGRARLTVEQANAGVLDDDDEDDDDPRVVDVDGDDAG